MIGGIKLAVALGLGQGAQQTLSMDDAIQIAERNAFSIQTSNANLEKLRLVVEQGRSGLGPSLTFNGTYQRFDRVFAGELGQSSVNLQLSQAIDIMGNVRRGVRAARESYDAGHSNVETAKNDLHRDVRKSYIRVLQASALMTVQKEAVKDQEATLKNTEDQFRAGAVAKVDVLRAKTQLAQSQSDLIAATNNYQLAKEAFNNTLARPIDTPFDLVDLTSLPEVPGSVENYVKEAQVKRPEVVGLKHTLSAARYNTKINERGLQPSLNLAIQPSYNPSPGFGGFKTQVVGVLSLAFPLWDSGATRARVKSSRQDEKLLEIQVQQVALGISLEVSQAFTNLENSKARYSLAQDQLTLAEENFRIAGLRYKAGEGINLEVTDAETRLTQARIGVVNARYDYLSALADLQRAVGATFDLSKRGEISK